MAVDANSGGDGGGCMTYKCRCEVGHTYMYGVLDA